MTSKKLSRRQQLIAQNADRDSILEYAAYSLVNIHDLLAAARTLANAHHYGQARSIAIMAQEELGKFIQAIMHLADATSTEMFIKNAWDHQSKQQSGNALLLMVDCFSLLAKSNPQVMIEAYKAFLSSDGRIVGTSDVDQLVSIFEARAPELEQLIAGMATDKRQLELERQDGFYVSLTTNEHNKVSVKHPRLVTRDEASDCINNLSRLTEGTLSALLEPILDNQFGSLDYSDTPLPTLVEHIKEILETLVQRLKAASCTADT